MVLARLLSLGLAQILQRLKPYANLVPPAKGLSRGLVQWRGYCPPVLPPSLPVSNGLLVDELAVCSVPHKRRSWVLFEGRRW